MDDAGDDDVSLQFIEFRMPPPKELSDEERNTLIRSIMTSICETIEDEDEVHVPIEGGGTTELGILLLVRMVTRVALPPNEDGDGMQNAEKEEDDKASDAARMNILSKQEMARQAICDYVVKKFSSR